MRVTSQILFRTAITHIQQQNGRLFRTQEEAASGHKLLRLSDDPLGTKHVLDFNQEIASLDQFQTNRDLAAGLLAATDDAFQSVETLMQRAQEVILAGLSDGVNTADRQIMATEVRELAAEALQLGNTELAGRFVFAGHAETSQPPFSEAGHFVGESEPFTFAVAEGEAVSATIVGSQFLASDLRPSVDTTTPLSALHDGQGVTPGSIRITDRVGNSAVINLSAATTVGDIANTISAVATINVAATSNAAGDGFVILDNNSSPTQNLTIEEVGGGDTAQALGLLASRPGDIVGSRLRPELTTATPVTMLHGGAGITLTSLRITNGATEVEVDLSAALTVGDVLTTIDAAGANVTASIAANGAALEVRSTDAATVAVVTEVGGGTTAADLGIQGGRDIVKTLQLIQEALEQEDLQALDRLLIHTQAGLEQVHNLRGEAGARLRRVQQVDDVHAARRLTVTSLLSQTRDADAVETFSRLSQQTFALEATLASVAQVVQPSLLNFLR